MLHGLFVWRFLCSLGTNCSISLLDTNLSKTMVPLVYKSADTGISPLQNRLNLTSMGNRHDSSYKFPGCMCIHIFEDTKFMPGKLYLTSWSALSLPVLISPSDEWTGFSWNFFWHVYEVHKWIHLSKASWPQKGTDEIDDLINKDFEVSIRRFLYF